MKFSQTATFKYSGLPLKVLGFFILSPLLMGCMARQEMEERPLETVAKLHLRPDGFVASPIEMLTYFN